MVPLLAGMAMALGSIAAATVLEGGSFGALIAPAPLLLVFVGAIGASLASFDMSEWGRVPKAIIVALKGGNVPSADGLITQFAKFADVARREGTLALESEISKVEDTFLKTGLQLVVDGVDGDQVKEVMQTEIHSLDERHHAMTAFFDSVGGFSPTFGLIGTVVGLIGVLGNLSDPEKLGHGMALGLLGTLWGILGANIFFIPLATKLKRLHEQEMAVRNLTLEGILAIREGVATRLLVERLEARIAPSQRVGHSQRTKGGGGAPAPSSEEAAA